MIQLLLPEPKSCQAILSEPLPTRQDCTRCRLATLAYLTSNQGDFELVVPCEAQLTT